MAPVEHTAAPKSWDCRICSRPWPCEEARRALMEEMNSVQLAVFASMQLEQAVRDLPELSVAAAFERFIFWTRPAASA